MRDIYYKCEPHKLEINYFSNTIAFNDLKCAFLPLIVNCLRGLVIRVLDSYFGDRGFEPQPNLLLCLLYLIFYWRILFIELSRYILKLILIIISNLKEICPWILLPEELP